MDYDEFYVAIAHNKTIMLHDNKYTYVFTRQIIENRLFYRLSKYENNIKDSFRIYGAKAPLYADTPEKEVVKILNKSSYFIVFD